MSQSIMFIAQGLRQSMEMIGNALATSNNANSQNPYFPQNTFIRNIPPAANNVQYLQGAHQLRRNFLLVGRCSLLYARCSLRFARCSLLLLVTFCSLLFARCSLLFAHCSLISRPNYCEIKLL